MPSLINQKLMDRVSLRLADLHDTFSREITVYKNAKRVAIASSPSFNAIYGNSGATNTSEYQTVSATFSARIYYLKMDEEFFQNSSAGTDSQNKIIMPNGSVKIVVDPRGYLFIREARKVEFDGITFSIRSDGNPIGLFSNQYYEFLLTPIDE
jgi:hypothetical protein